MAYERRLGVPRTDVERVMAHYGVGYAEAERGLKEGRYVLPARGTRLRLQASGEVAFYLGLATIGAGLILTAWGLSTS